MTPSEEAACPQIAEEDHVDRLRAATTSDSTMADERRRGRAPRLMTFWPF